MIEIIPKEFSKNKKEDFRDYAFKPLFQIMKKNSNTILLNKNTFENLKLKIGEKVNIQNKNLTVIGYLKNIPDIGGAFVFGDYAMINNITLDELKLQALGNLINKLLIFDFIE